MPECKNCGSECDPGMAALWHGCCSEGCEVAYINENYRDDDGNPIY